MDTLFSSKSNKFAINIQPKDYGKSNQELPNEIPNPKRNCGFHTGSCKALIASWIVPSNKAIIYDSTEDTIKLFKSQVGDNCDIIECKNGNN